MRTAGPGIPVDDKTGKLCLADSRWIATSRRKAAAEGAQELGANEFMLPWISTAERLLQESLALWQPLHDPEPERSDQNFQLDGNEYNVRAAKRIV